MGPFSGPSIQFDEPHVQGKSRGQLNEIQDLSIIEVADDKYIELDFWRPGYDPEENNAMAV
jgi:hypothetical protein